MIFRNHDRIHACDPDGVRFGIVEALGWGAAFNPTVPRIVDIAPTSLGDIMAMVAQRLDAPNLHYIGDPTMLVRRMHISPGYNSFRSVLPVWREHNPDLLIAGEIFEWEAAEYFRDAVALGHRKAVLFTGHSVSEEPGSAWMATWLKAIAPTTPIHHIPSGEPVTRFPSASGR